MKEEKFQRGMRNRRIWFAIQLTHLQFMAHYRVPSSWFPRLPIHNPTACRNTHLGTCPPQEEAQTADTKRGKYFLSWVPRDHLQSILFFSRWTLGISTLPWKSLHVLATWIFCPSSINTFLILIYSLCSWNTFVLLSFPWIIYLFLNTFQLLFPPHGLPRIGKVSNCTYLFLI